MDFKDNAQDFVDALDKLIGGITESDSVESDGITLVINVGEDQSKTIKVIQKTETKESTDCVINIDKNNSVTGYNISSTDSNGEKFEVAENDKEHSNDHEMKDSAANDGDSEEFEADSDYESDYGDSDGGD